MKTLTQLSKNFFDLLKDNPKHISASDLLCFQNAVLNFLNSGKKDDAFTVYFCFSEIFKVFGTGYDNTQKLLETLSDHEYHSGELLAKHRDHYSHSVYVFSLGLAIYANDEHFRKEFNKFYFLSENESYYSFLHTWGLVALFHDIGYPFQLAHEQIKNYLEELWVRKDKDGKPIDVNGRALSKDEVKLIKNSLPYVSFGNIDAFLMIDSASKIKLEKQLQAKRNFSSINELLAYGVEQREGYDFDFLVKKLKDRVVYQPNFMDHGYFSAVILLKRLFENPQFSLDMQLLDVLTAILLHNSLNKYDIENSHRIAANEHPLAYLLILCDELQAWDRRAYGKNSKRKPIAWDVEFEISNNIFKAVYYFENQNENFDNMLNGKFVGDIHKFIDTDLSLNVFAEKKAKDKKYHLYASDDNFINLCDFAKAIHASYDEHCDKNDIEHINTDFANLPLEFKVSNIEQAKSYAYKLELINCFYSSKKLDYPIVEDFNMVKSENITSDTIGFLCREEHARWVKEKLSLGWKYGTDYSNTEERNTKKIHKDIVPYELLSSEEQSKDRLMITNIIPLLNKLGNGIKIYQYRAGRKPNLVIAGTGHRYFNDDKERLKKQIKSILMKYAKDFRVIVRTCYASGADWLIAECACELGLTTKAVLPMPYEDYIVDVIKDAKENNRPLTDEDIMKMRTLLAQTVVCKVMPDSKFKYYEANKYLIEKCDKVIALWDGKKLPLVDNEDRPINRGGTYHAIKCARERGLKDGSDIHIIDCFR